MGDDILVKDHNTLFSCDEYAKSWAQKQAFENAADEESLNHTREWSRSEEYKEKNFQRQALTVNPAKACQPLGALLCSSGFEGTLPLIHGSQGCVAYFRSHYTRHFKEPCSAVSSSMTEDAAVFGGLKNLVEALENARALYQPTSIAVATTCMAEVIGDDLSAFIGTARNKEAIPKDFPVPFAHTPSFVGSHITGYDNMMKGILEYYARGSKSTPCERINIIPGFETYIGNFSEIKYLLGAMGTDSVILSDPSEVFDSPTDGHYRMYYGGTKLDDVKNAINHKATLALQKYSTKKTMEYITNEWQQDAITLPVPMGIRGTDRFIQELSRLTGQEVPESLNRERGKAIDAMTDSSQYLHGKRVALIGDPDLLNGLLSFLLEVGAEPIHVMSTNGDKEWAADAKAILEGSSFGRNATVYPGKDMWHFRSLLWTEPVDLMIGNTYLKYLSRETDIPLVRIGFPIFDRHHLHRYSTLGYRGIINLITWITNTILEDLDQKAPAHSFDAIR